MARSKKTQRKDKILKITSELRACTVALCNIAFDADLIQRYQLNLPLKQEKQSPINTSTHSKKQSLKGSVQKKNGTRNRKRTTTNISKEIVKEEKRKDHRKIEPQQIYKFENMHKDISSHQDNKKIPKLRLRRVKLCSNVKPVSSESIDETSCSSSVTHFNYMQNMTMLMNNKNDKNVKKPSTKIRIDSEEVQHLIEPVTNESAKLESNDTNCLDKNNLTVNDHNSNTQEISSKSIIYTQRNNNNNNLYPVNFSDGVRCKVKQERCKMKKNNKDIIVQTTTCHAEVSENINSSKVEIKPNLPKIIGNCVFSKEIKVLKGAQKEIKVDGVAINNSLHTIGDTIEDETTNRENHTSLKINGSSNILNSILPLNNNIDSKDKNTLNNKFNSKFIDYKNLNSWTRERKNGYIDINSIDSETTMTQKNYTLNEEQLSRFTSNIEVYENNALQDNEKCEEKYTKNILNKNQHIQEISNPIDTDDESCSTSFMSTSKANDIKQIQKRTLEEKDKDSNLGKKIKLNRNNWQNNETSKPIKRKRYNIISDSSSSEASITADTTTDIPIKLDISEEHNQKEKMDLREHLDQIRSTKTLNTTKTENEEICKKLSVKEETSILNKTLCEKKNSGQEKHTSISDDDDDYISIFAESFAEFDIIQEEDKFVPEKDKSHHSIHFDVPYEMTANSFDKYVKQNNNEFNRVYAECIENNTEIKTEPSTSNKPSEVLDNQLTQTLSAYCIPAIVTDPNSLQIRNVGPIKENLYNFKGCFHGYCFKTLRNNMCYRQQCTFEHNLRKLFNTISTKDGRIIINIIKEALQQSFNYFCDEVYISLLRKLTSDQILKTYNMLYETSSFYSRKEFTDMTRRNIATNIIGELLKRHMPIREIAERMMTYILPTKNLHELYNIIICLKNYMKRDEYWNTIRNLISQYESNIRKYIINKILHDCIMNKNFENMQDVHSNLISKLEPTIISTLDGYILQCFQNMLVEKSAEKSYPNVMIQNFGQKLTTETIASPDQSPNTSFMQQESSTKYDNSISETDSNQSENRIIQAENVKPYEYGYLQPIDAPSAECTYKDHERFWKFFVNLDRFKKGLIHEDYDYIIDVLKSYDSKKREKELFVSKCSLILRKVEGRENHLKNILRRTVQTGTFNILDKIIFDIGLDILANLVDEEAWGLALQLIQTLNIYDLPYNAVYFLLSAETYLANKKAVKACDLLKYKNIICTSREKWYVKSTINDEYVRTKIIYILLDSFCNEFLEHAFFLFEFLLKDQSSYYYPIDLTRYVDKLIILSLLKTDSNVTTEMAQLVLKHSFALSTITCRALISTIIHTDEVLAKQIYNYAVGIGIYSTVKLLPVIHIVINTDLTEEEIYLLFRQLLENIIMNYGHAIEFAKPTQIKVYYILEIKSTKQFYCATLQHHHNNQTILKTKALIRTVLRKRFDPPISLVPRGKGRIGKLQSKSLINYLKSEHCN